MVKLYDILKAEKTGLSDSIFTTMLANKLSAPTATVKELESLPPLTFTAIGEPLIDWSLDGAAGGVGDQTNNLFNKKELLWNSGILNDDGQPQSSTASHYTGNYISVEPNTNYYFSGTLTSGTAAYRFYYYDSSKQWISRTSGGSRSFTTPADCYYMQVQCSVNIENGNDWMLSKGSSAISYEPYGFKIPVTCGGETKTIYLDAPLGASDSISMTDTSISIPTVNGSNTLSVGTAVQPSSVYIKYKG